MADGSTRLIESVREGDLECYQRVQPGHSKAE